MDLTTELPDGYTMRPTRKIVGSTSKTWNDRWDYELKNLWLSAGFSWRRAGFGHTGSGILRALESRGMVEVAEHPRLPLVVRLRPDGAHIGMGLAAELAANRGDTEERPPANAVLGYRPAPRSAYPGRPTVQKIRPTVLTPDEAHLAFVLADEIQAIDEAFTRFEQYEADGEIYDREHWDRLKVRRPELAARLAAVTGAQA